MGWVCYQSHAFQIQILFKKKCGWCVVLGILHWKKIGFVIGFICAKPAFMNIHETGHHFLPHSKAEIPVSGVG